VDDMALYLTDRIEKGKLDYLAVFKISRYTPLKEDVDAMLTVDEYQNLIVPIV
jgi:hypothetical protein